jgi:phage terminase large subunit-like protein
MNDSHTDMTIEIDLDQVIDYVNLVGEKEVQSTLNRWMKKAVMTVIERAEQYERDRIVNHIRVNAEYCHLTMIGRDIARSLHEVADEIGRNEHREGNRDD